MTINSVSGPSAASAYEYRGWKLPPTTDDIALQETRWAELSGLTESDRSFLQGAIGYSIPRRENGDVPASTPLASEIARARQNGTLKPGQTVSADFLRDLSRWYSDDSMGSQIRQGLDYLNANRNRPTFDITA